MLWRSAASAASAGSAQKVKFLESDTEAALREPREGTGYRRNGVLKGYRSGWLSRTVAQCMFSLQHVDARL
jgi:hypothetical protein